MPPPPRAPAPPLAAGVLEQQAAGVGQALDQPAELGPELRRCLSRIILTRQNALTESVDRGHDEACVGRRIRAAELLHRDSHR
jgi:hypothetical protein